VIRKKAKENGRASRAGAKPSLSAFHPLARNPNTHTQQGLGQLDAAMSRHGYVAPMTAAADGAILDGNARLETVATKFPASSRSSSDTTGLGRLWRSGRTSRTPTTRWRATSS
jgi:hypothetical protein